MPSERDKTSEKPSPWLLASWLTAAGVLAAILHDQSFAVPIGLVAFSLLPPLAITMLTIAVVRRIPRKFSLRDAMIVVTLACVCFATCAGTYRLLAL